MPDAAAQPPTLEFGCTLNTFDPDLPPADILRMIAAIGYVSSDLQCDGPFFPYADATVSQIAAVVAETGLRLECVNSMTAGFFWRQRAVERRVMKHSGPDFSDPPEAYAEYGVPDAGRWRLDRVEACMQLARRLGVPRLNANVGSGVDVDREAIWPRILKALEDMRRLSHHYGVQICLETEPSLYLRGREDIERAFSAVGDDDCFVWGYDIGHQIKLHRGDHAQVIRDMHEMAGRIGYFHIEDISREDWEGDPLRHTHLCLSDGDIDFPPIWRAVVAVRTRAAADGRRIPVLYENYNAFDRDPAGSAATAYAELIRLACTRSEAA